MEDIKKTEVHFCILLYKYAIICLLILLLMDI